MKETNDLVKGGEDRDEAIDALIASRASLVPESLSAALLGLDKAVQRYVSQHRTFGHQVSATRRALLDISDSLIVLSLGDETNTSLLNERLSKSHKGGNGLNGLGERDERVIRRIVREELKAADPSSVIIELLSGRIDEKSAELSKRLDRAVPVRPLKVVDPVGKVADGGVDMVDAIGECDHAGRHELPPAFGVIGRRGLGEVVSCLHELVHLSTSFLLGALIVALVKRKGVAA